MNLDDGNEDLLEDDLENRGGLAEPLLEDDSENQGDLAQDLIEDDSDNQEDLAQSQSTGQAILAIAIPALGALAIDPLMVR